VSCRFSASSSLIKPPAFGESIQLIGQSLGSLFPTCLVPQIVLGGKTKLPPKFARGGSSDLGEARTAPSLSVLYSATLSLNHLFNTPLATVFSLFRNPSWDSFNKMYRHFRACFIWLTHFTKLARQNCIPLSVYTPAPATFGWENEKNQHILSWPRAR
jgi:hypothetical protein